MEGFLHLLSGGCASIQHYLSMRK